MDVAVTSSGKTDLASTTVVSTTNRLFIESLRPHLTELRFRPADTARRAVPGHTVVTFVFAIDDRCHDQNAAPRMGWNAADEPAVVTITTCSRVLGTYDAASAKAAAKRRLSTPPPPVYDTVAHALGLVPLSRDMLPAGTREFRFWIGGGLTIPETVVRVVDNGHGVTGAVGGYWKSSAATRLTGAEDESTIMHRTFGDVCQSLATSGGREGCWMRFSRVPDWQRLGDSLDRLRVSTLRDQLLIKHDAAIINDGWGIIVEYRHGSHYRWYSYSNPNAYEDAEDRRADATVRALHMVTDLVISPKP